MLLEKRNLSLFLLSFFILGACAGFNQKTETGDFQATALETIGLEITSHLGDHQTFLAGDTLSFLINLEQDAYLLVIYEDAAGHLTQIIPNATNQEGYYRSGIFIPLPEENAPYQFKVQAPFGQEKVWVFAADASFQKRKGKTLGNGLIALGTSLPNIREKIKTKKMTAFGEASLTIQTQAKNKI